MVVRIFSPPMLLCDAMLEIFALFQIKKTPREEFNLPDYKPIFEFGNLKSARKNGEHFNNDFSEILRLSVSIVKVVFWSNASQIHKQFKFTG